MPFVSFEQLCRYSDDLAENQARMLKAEADAKALREQLATCRALLREACETLRDIANNYDCDSDAHKYGTPCRACEAKQVVTHVEAARAAGGGE